MSDDERLALQARECPLIRGALESGDDAVIASAMRVHPPERCACVRQAADA